ncbi:hypothetical protein [Longimicrobium sp.]|uniref:hypothetical protein n=1 Tax=Longimicrobium sp. TaxID=2029185 RepID=UPI002E30A784|nr:hypothetical protein [Longimicrobium sp.]HEX6041544.1 hypothetical protein [Longimicrobium sp.]
MSQHHPKQHPPQPADGEHAPRAGDRRGTDRRRVERRAPPPMWRRPWALVSYGVVGAFALVLLWNTATRRDEPQGARDEALVEKQPTTGTVVAADNPQATASGTEDAYGSAGFERLVVQGEGAVGKVVRTELYCEAPQNFTVIQGHTAPRSVASLIQEGRVPAARCRWGAPSEPRREEFLLIVPPDLVDEFSAAPVVQDNFVERRRVRAEVEWVGRSQTLALRTAGVFRGLVAQ